LVADSRRCRVGVNVSFQLQSSSMTVGRRLPNQILLLWDVSFSHTGQMLTPDGHQKQTLVQNGK